MGTQGVIGPDFIMYDWYDSPVGRRGDKHFLRDSLVNQTLRASQQFPVGRRQFWVYLDKGYDIHSHCRCAAHGGRRRLNLVQGQDNYIMSLVREVIEWGFGNIKNRNSLLKKHNLLKIQMVDVAKLVRVGVLLTNAFICLDGGIGNLYFHCAPPTLHEYFL